MVAMRSDDFGGPGKVKNFETIFVTRSGEQIPVAISGSILYDDNGLEIGSIGFAKDIREIRQRDRLATLGEVAVALCHEINSPLEVILNDIELLERLRAPKATDEEAVVEEERVDAVRREVLKIQEIVNRLVEMSREGQLRDPRVPGRPADDRRRRGRPPSRARGAATAAWKACASWWSTTISASAARCATCCSPRAARCWWPAMGCERCEILNRTLGRHHRQRRRHARPRRLRPLHGGQAARRRRR